MNLEKIFFTAVDELLRDENEPKTYVNVERWRRFKRISIHKVEKLASTLTHRHSAASTFVAISI